MKILVKYNNSYYYWVDTVVMHDEYYYTCAVLVSSSGSAFPICIDKIEVIDDNYNYEKEKQKKIDELNWRNSMLQQQMEIDKKNATIMGR